VERVHRGLARIWGKRDEVGRGRLTGPYETSLRILSLFYAKDNSRTLEGIFHLIMNRVCVCVCVCV
jgi:hypothetical protein